MTLMRGYWLFEVFLRLEKGKVTPSQLPPHFEMDIVSAVRQTNVYPLKLEIPNGTLITYRAIVLLAGKGHWGFWSSVMQSL